MKAFFQSATLVTPERGVLALCLGQILFWTLAPLLSHSAPPLDVVEMYAWGREGVVATFKHPNLPGLVLEATRWVTGAAGAPAYLVSQLFVVLTYWAVYRLGCELMDKQRALAGTLLLAGVYFFSWPTPEFNHNVAQMPLWALSIWMLWRATTKGQLWAWALFGLITGLSFWAKYSSVVLAAAAAAWILWDNTARRKILTPGPWLALVLFAAVVAPQAQWLIEHDYQSLHYAARRAGGGSDNLFAPLEFILSQTAHHLPMLLLLLIAGWFGKAALDAKQPEQRVRRFLLLMGLGPLVLAAVGAQLTGAALKSAWAAPMLDLSGLLAVALLWRRFEPARLQRLAVGVAVMLPLVAGLYFAHMRFGALLTDKPLRGNWPQATLSHALETEWREQTEGAPLRIVAGDIWTAGLVGMSDSKPPSVLINGDFSISPWVTPEELRRDGALLVWQEGAKPPAILDQAPQNTLSHLRLRYRQFPDAPPLEINYVIIPPAQN